MILSFIAFLILTVVGGIWMNQAKHDASEREKYHLQPAQMKQVKALKEEHERIYRQLTKQAEENRKRVEVYLAANEATLPTALALRAETNAMREALWIEELRYCRAVSALMNDTDARLYLAPLEKRFAERRPDAQGYLNIPHK